MTPQSQLRTLLSLLPGLCNPGTPRCSSASQCWHPSHCQAWASLSCDVTSLAEPRGAAVLGMSWVWGFRSPQHRSSPAFAASPFPAKHLFLQMPAGVFLLAGDVFRYPRLHSLKLTAKAQFVLISSFPKRIFGCRVPSVTLKKLLRTLMTPRFSVLPISPFLCLVQLPRYHI